MKLGVVGVGQAGGKVLDRLLEYDSTRNTGFISHAVAVNSAEQDLQGLDHVPASNRHLVGQSIVGGQGAGTDPEAGAACVREDIEEIGSAIDRVSATEIDGFVLIAGLGGGTGSGGAPVIAERLQEVYLEPVYGLGILPSTDEGGIYNRNAADTLQRFIDRVDNVMLFDNGAFRSSGESLSEGYAGINDEITTRFGTLFSAGEIDAMGDTVAESVVDSSEIVNTLGERGLTSIGYASEPVATDTGGGGLLDRVLGSDDSQPEYASDSDATNRITGVVRRAALGTLTLPCGIESTSRALLIVSGPPEHLSRKGIDSAREWLEETTECREVRAGDYPLPNEEKVAAVVVLAGVTDVPRIEEIQGLAADAAAAETEAGTAEDEFEALIEYDDSE